MSDSSYHITESSESNFLKKGQNRTHMAMFWNFSLDDVIICKHMYSAMYDVIKAFLTRMWDQKKKKKKIVMAILHVKQGFAIW